MKSKSYFYTENVRGQFEYVGREEKIDSLDLAMEIYSFLADYFNGTFAKNTKGVLMKMENGQIFQLIVTEVK